LARVIDQLVERDFRVAERLNELDAATPVNRRESPL
jgi:hypothetical protein